jgi:hypothetical protein
MCVIFQSFDAGASDLFLLALREAPIKTATATVATQK